MQKEKNDAYVQVPLASIEVDPGQPRKTFDQQAHDDLVASIEANGLIQPIGIRKQGKNYIVVFGERRFRAAKSLESKRPELSTIMARVFSEDMSLDQIREIQLTENLLREDVHPVEEADTIAELAKTMSMEEISAKIGKPVRFIKDRVRLTYLTPEWKNAVHKNLLSYDVALSIAALPESTQIKFAKDENVKSRVKAGVRLDITNFNISRYMGDLKQATWPLEKELKDLPICVGCKFNSGTAQLFELEGGVQKCSNISCFEKKQAAQYKESLEEAKKDPSVSFVVNGYFSKDDIAKITKYAKVDKVDGDLSFIRKPEEPTLEDTDYDESMTVRKKELAELKEEYEKDLDKYNKSIATGKYVRAFILEGKMAGTYVYALREKEGKVNGTASKLKEKIAENTVTVDDLDAEILRIKEREKRNRELDINKIHIAIGDALETDGVFEKVTINMNAQVQDKAILLHCLYESASYTEKEAIKKVVAWPDYTPKSYDEKYFAELQKFSEKKVAQIARIIAAQRWMRTSHDISVDHTAVRIMAKYSAVDIKAIEKAQNLIAIERYEKGLAKIKDLQDKKKKLAPAKALPAAKKVKELA